MKKLFMAPLFFAVLSAAFSQGIYQDGPETAGSAAETAEDAPDTTENTLGRLDGAIKGIAADLHKRLAAEGPVKAGVRWFSFQDNIPMLGSYWNTQLIHELASIQGRSWILLAPPAAGAEWIISGEIVEIVDTLRVYTRIIRAQDQSIQASFQSDLNRDAFILEMLAGGSSSSALRDTHEPDSMDNPVPVRLAEDDSGPAINRTIHNSNDEDFFLLTPDKDGAMICETTGSMDTYMTLYDESGSEIASNDDGGSNGNARIRRTVRAGSRCIAVVRGYSGETGSYGFRSYLTSGQGGGSDEYEDDDSFAAAKDIAIGTPQRHTFYSGDDVDWVKFEVTEAGTYTIHTRGLNNNRLDTYIELFDADQRSIDDDDDGGEGLDSRISRRLEKGVYYLKVECLADDPDQPYTISISAAAPEERIDPDEYEDDNILAMAKDIAIGTPQRHTFHSGGDVDWVKFEITGAGTYTIRTQGANNNQLDTYIELFDADQRSIDDDDDGGEGYDSRISRRLEKGLYYLRVECLADYPNQPYTISITGE